MITIPSLSDVTDILDTDQVMVTNAQGQSYKIAGSELNKRHKVIIASSTTVTGTPLKSGWPVRIYFTADITAANATTTMQINYNNVNYYVKVPKNGALANYVAFNLGGSPAVFKYVQAYTTLELLFDGTQFIIMCNPVVISGTNFSIYADGLKRIDEVTENGTDLVTSHAVAAAIDKVKDIMGALPTDAVLHYSFDEVPDLPDGTAVYKKDNDFTDTTGWNSNGNTPTVTSGKITLGGNNNTYARYSLQISANSMICVRGIANKTSHLYFTVRHSGASSDTTLEELDIIQGEPFEIYVIVDAQSVYFNFYVYNSEWSITLSQIYIGDGSYATPIIDNAKGQYNATNNGGIATKGVSGKGAYFLNGKYAKINSNFKLKPNFSISFWVNLISGASYGQLYRNPNVFTIVLSNVKNVNIYMYDENGNALLNNVRVTTYTQNGFVLMTATRNGTDFDFYINGEKVYNKTLANNTIRTYEEDITFASTTGNIEFIADDLLIFDRALTETEVMALYLNKANTPKYYPPAQLPS